MRKPKAPSGCYWDGHVLYGRARVKGRLHRWSLQTSDPKIAKKARDEEVARLKNAAYHGIVQITFDEVLPHWVKWIEKQVGPNTSARYAVSLAQIQPWLQGKFLDQITIKLVSEIAAGRDTSNATKKRDLNALSSVLRYAMTRGWKEDNPVLNFLHQKPLKERRDPIILPLIEDVEKVIADAPGAFAHLIRAAWLTGARQNELVEARRDQLDLKAKTLTVIGKGNKRRTIDLKPFDGWKLFEALQFKSDYVFWHGPGEKYHNASSRFAAITARLNLKHRFRFHDLRHLHAVEWLRSGRSIYDLQQRMGHSSIKVTEIYLEFLTPDQVRLVQGIGS